MMQITALSYLLLALLIQGTTPAPVSSLPGAQLLDEPLSVPAIVYPDDARHAHVQGAVQLEITVDATGQVTKVRALSGPLPLRQAAIDAYQKAVYRPLIQKGRATPALITATVNFNLKEVPPDNDTALGKQFAPLHARCEDLSRQQDAEALATCRDAVEVARKFSPGTALNARSTALNDLALELMRQKNFSEASTIADESVELVAGMNHPHTAAAATAYITRCEVRSLTRDYAGAAGDCATAEETLRTLIADQSAPDQQKEDRTANFRAQLREVYELHAIVLLKDGHAEEARRLRQRAKKV